MEKIYLLPNTPKYKANLHCHTTFSDGAFTPEKIKEIYKQKYKGPLVKFEDELSESGFISAGLLSGKDSMIISVFGNGDRIILTASYDNLGKGASGAAVECMNIVLGNDDTEGLEI